jgi:hypothetical protein
MLNKYLVAEKQLKEYKVARQVSMLNGLSVTSAWHVFRLRLEEKAFICGGQLRI